MYMKDAEMGLADAFRRRQEALEAMDANEQSSVMWGNGDNPRNPVGYFGRNQYKTDDAFQKLQWADQDIANIKKYLSMRGYEPASIRDEELRTR
jgi:hypothetical protein